MNSNIPFHVPIETNEKFENKFFAILLGLGKITTVTLILSLSSDVLPAKKISPIGPAVWAVGGGGAIDLGSSSTCK